ncbi:MAG: hypothetical protein DBX61_03685 [Clostridiales bacterium]|nr:MAG: hypothetical protein DBX61_03685 [Clostridiales bacterium]
MSVFFMPKNMKGLILMQNEQELRDLLYEKMCNEQENFIEKLKHSTPEKIIEPENETLSHEQVKALSKLDSPLSACYNEWLGNDCSYMDMLRDTVTDFAEGLAEKAEQQKAQKKKHEPER